MTASSFYSSSYYPYFGRLNGNRGVGAWTPDKTDKTDYLQVDMGAVRSVCAVATQGRKIGNEWAKGYKFYVSKDGLTWNAYTENNVEKVSE